MKTATLPVLTDGIIEVEFAYGPNENKVHGRYEKIGNVFWLREWKVSFRLPESASRTEGNWYRIHGNQKKPIGCLKLCCIDSLPSFLKVVS